MKQRTSKIWTVSNEELQTLFNESSTRVEILEKLGFDGYNGNHRTLKLRVDEGEIDLTQFDENYMKFMGRKLGKVNKRPDLEVFCINSTYTSNKDIKKRLIKDHGRECICVGCGVGDTYNDIPISLQLDHINGINNDNRFENLRFLCPNCHSQTSTFSGKRHKIDYTCISCGNSKKTKLSERCDKCSDKQKGLDNRKFNPTKEELYEMVCVDKTPFTKLGILFGVSDNAVRKRCVKYGIDPKKRE